MADTETKGGRRVLAHVGEDYYDLNALGGDFVDADYDKGAEPEKDGPSTIAANVEVGVSFALRAYEVYRKIMAGILLGVLVLIGILIVASFLG